MENTNIFKEADNAEFQLPNRLLKEHIQLTSCTLDQIVLLDQCRGYKLEPFVRGQSLILYMCTLHGVFSDLLLNNQMQTLYPLDCKMKPHLGFDPEPIDVSCNAITEFSGAQTGTCSSKLVYFLQSKTNNYGKDI